MKIRELILEKTNNGRINIINYPSSKPADKTVLCIHGFCSDARIFNYIATQLSQRGFNVQSIDLLGHGKSDGSKGDTNFDKCLESINELIKKAKLHSKVFVLAHSIGCTYALWHAHNFKNSVDGLILLSPYIRIKHIKKRSEIEPSLPIFFYLFLRRLLTPKNKVKITSVLKNFVKVGGEEISQMLQDDELNFYYSYRYIIDIIAMRNSRVSEVSDVDVPILILHGKNDRNVYPDVGEEFYKLLLSKDKKIKLFDCDHWFYDAMFYNQLSEKYTEELRMEVIESIANWLSNR